MVCLRRIARCRMGCELNKGCAGGVAVAAAVVAGARAAGHRPLVGFIVESRMPVVCCTRCGCHSEAGSNILGLGRRCLHRECPDGKAAGPRKGAR